MLLFRGSVGVVGDDGCVAFTILKENGNKNLASFRVVYVMYVPKKKQGKS